jgi:ABC-type transport system substrate-binding protein
MNLFVWRWLAASSLMVAALGAMAETRPQYGGTLHIAMRAAPLSLDPADRAQADSSARHNLTPLLFDTLVTTDAFGHGNPALAESWQASANHQQWQFRLRHGITFHDGTAFTAETAAASLRAANPMWKVAADSDSIVINLDVADPDLLAELALPRNAIAKRTADGRVEGTGPFRVVDWQPGKTLTLAAAENYWQGRPYLDNIAIELGRSFRDQMTALQLGKADFIEVSAEQSHRVSLEGRQTSSSAPIELVALVFTKDAQSPEEKLLRQALALSVERGSIRNVLLQGTGQPAGGILPNWMSGYEFVFSAEADLARARHIREQVRAIPTWTIGYDTSDPISRLLVDRIALNAKDAGFTLQPSAAAATDLKLVRMPLESDNPWVALGAMAAVFGLPLRESKTGSIEDLYLAEQTALAAGKVIPLFHLPISYAAASTMKDWTLRPDGTWSIADAWLGPGKP